MRNAVGAAWIFGLCLVFIILFTSYLTISMNYAKAFRIKNYIVSVVEENEGYRAGIGIEERVSEYLYNQGYDSFGTCDSYIEVDGYDQEWEQVATIDMNDNVPTDNHSACIYRLISYGTGDKDINVPRTRYRVVTFFKFNLPVVRYFTQFQVAGESRYIYDFAYGGY